MSMGGEWGQKHLAINRLRDITPTVSDWGTDPTNLGNITDNDWDTVTGTGSTILGGAGIVGRVMFDMGAEYTVLVGGKIGMWSTANEMRLYFYWSLDGVTWNPMMGGGNIVMAETVAAESLSTWASVYVRTRHIRLQFYCSGAATANAKLYEVQAIEFADVF